MPARWPTKSTFGMIIWVTTKEKNGEKLNGTLNRMRSMLESEVLRLAKVIQAKTTQEYPTPIVF
jgi:hypothetical protein